MNVPHPHRPSLWLNARLATMDPVHGVPYGALEGHSLLLRDGHIEAVMPQAEADAAAFDGEVFDLQGRWVTPGFVDCHTHLVYGGSRAAEWEKRLTGVPYQQIAAEGGGIVSTVRATRWLDEEELALASLPRLKALMAEGVTTVEIKSGYGLTLADELKQLAAARRLEASLPVEVATTLLAAHAVPPEYTGDADGYVDLVVESILPVAARAGLAEAVDAFCESVGFSPAQTRRVFEAARAHGLKVKGHVEQLSNLHGAELVAEFGGLSADHIEYLDDAGVAALKRAGTVAVLLPGAFYFLRETQKPPVDKLRAAGVPMAVSTDLNPGTSPFASIRLAMNQACVLFGLTPEEALAGVTRHAAQALGRGATHGRLAAGCVADLLVWDIAHPAELAYSVGVPLLKQRVFRGEAQSID
ncbi:imidazolonepropionase [Chromobacterium violaceum]|uniref:imidazolonepropionase n=1 Tax=Chromobacterium violaceum TaxID=536 RepID=UPI0009DB423B|nr:imidazolonepropionase [Chromobacterium violaceum]MBX9269157.1 imidazolonepropionase [Chromobacterium violaceum]OQS45652.1 imidazolonepropionase [Chromobacterium violaceum]OQS47440.1 imidazolonepropionase [Chromobacterium violaceum]QRO31966.1 imidazolonepropionase [Chromobacterium violaceum]QRQ18234.1 imidazolonepropionase [Chromobacterium violaceum]